MSKKQSTETLSKRLIPMAESAKLDDSRRNYSSEFAAGYLHSNKKKSDLSDQSISSPISTSNTSLYTPGRSTIDAQTYVDAQSNGFTTRIVRYEEENKKKSKVCNRMYKRPGDFPIVHLDKPKLVLSAKRSTVNPYKIARIGQPDPSIYRANIRAEILRNGTLMPQNSVDRREDVDSAIVRVDPLDALKEISRKRIHCEDTINQKQIGPIEKDSTDSVPSGTNFNNSKRQRINNSSLSLSTNDNNKRGHNFSKSNEIFSSLSSSSYMLSPPSSPLKRVETTSPSNSVVPPQTKRLQAEKSIEPPTIETSIKSVPKANEIIAPNVVETASYPTESPRPKLTLFNRPYSASALPPVSIDRNDRDDECNITFVKPRPMTARSRESVENWLKIKPDEKKRLSLMLKCLSGELDDGDTVDSKENETPVTIVPSNQNVQIDCPPKDVEVKSDAPAITIPTSESSTAQPNLNSTTISSSVTKPTIEFTPVVASVSVPVVKPVVETITQQVPLPAVEERKGGFSFPLPPSNITTQKIVSPIVTAPAVTSVSTTLAPVLAPSLSIEPSTKPTIEEQKDSTVTYTFQVPKQKAAIVPNVEATKGFTFGNITTTSESKSTPTFGSNITKLSEPQSVDPSGFGDIPKSTSFSVFGQQSVSTGSVEFGKTSATIPSTAVTSTAPIFGTMAIPNSSSNALNNAQPTSFGSISTTQQSLRSDKPQPPSFGSISTTQQSLSSDKPQPPSFGSISTSQQSLSNNKPIPLFSKNEQTQIFGSALSNNQPTFNTLKQLDPRTNTTTAFTSNQPSKPTTTTPIGSTASAPFTFGTAGKQGGTPATVSSVFQTVQPTQPPPASTFGNKPINSAANIFGSSATSSIFGSNKNSSTNLFDQTAKMGSSSNPIQNLTEPAKTVANAPNIFGSSAANPSSTFAFSGNNQSNPSNIFGGQTPTPGTFNFGGSNPQSAESTGSNSNINKAFSFSGSSVETTKPMAFGNKNVAPTFGSSNNIESSKSFGFTPTNQTNANNLFNNKSTNELPKVFSFGSSSNTPAAGAGNFESTNSMSSFGAANKTPSFGGMTTTPSFGGAALAATPSFGGASAMLSFGSTNAPSNAPSTFGGASATPTFGTSNAMSTFGTTNAAPTFGGSTPAFGGSTPSFGGSTPAFGGANNTPTFGSSGTQAFNGNIATPTFGGVTPLNNSGATVFGNSGTAAFTTSTGTADINKTFNFTGSDPTPSPIPNLFNIGPGNSAPGYPRGRTTRTATRRTYR